MLHTADTAAVDSLTAFATTMDYVLDEDGDFAFEYNLALCEVAKEIEMWQERQQLRAKARETASRWV